MPSVAEELAALKQRSLTKNLASKLKDADGLSTPEQEEAQLQKTQKTNRASLYKKDAAETLKAGSKAVDQDLAFKQAQTAQKKQDMQKKEEAAKNLKSFNTAKVAVANANTNKNNHGSSIPAAVASAPAAAAKAPPVAPVTAAADAAPTTPTITEVEDDDDDEIVPELDNDDGVPDLEEIEEVPDLIQDTPTPTTPGMAQSYAPATAPAKQRVPNRAEKKAKRTVEKLGMKHVGGIARVTLKINGNHQGFFTIFQPDVYEKNGTYIVFGEAQQGASGGGRMNQQAQAARAAKMLGTPVPAPTTAAAAITTPVIDEADETPVDETGLEAKDIELVISQAGCSRSKAVAALRENDGDLVNAIMSLTT